MKNFLLQFFTWWNGQTLGTRFHTWRHGKRVGEDADGNVYYQNSAGKRWVIYDGEADPSRIPAGWHGWMHNRTDTSPADEDYPQREWEMSHLANMTGSARAYRPQGSMARQEKRPEVTGDYEAWKP